MKHPLLKQPVDRNRIHILSYIRPRPPVFFNRTNNLTSMIQSNNTIRLNNINTIRHNNINTISSNPLNNLSKESTTHHELVLDRQETYDPNKEHIWCFKHVDDILEGEVLNLGNMTCCYPFEFEGNKWRSSEELYLSGEFSNPTEEHLIVQQELCKAKSPYAAKRFIKAKHRKKVREDFSEFRTQWMLLVVWIKCLGNQEFQHKLLSIPKGITLIEETTTDTGGSATVWGCSNPELVKARKEIEAQIIVQNSHLKKAQLKRLVNIETNAVRNIGLFKGQNNIGKILMICKRCLEEGTHPNIDIDLLRTKEIYILGKKLEFDKAFLHRYNLED